MTPARADTALIASTQEDRLQTIETLHTIRSEYGMAVDAKKTEVVVIEHEPDTECSITLHKEETELVGYK